MDTSGLRLLLSALDALSETDKKLKLKEFEEQRQKIEKALARMNLAIDRLQVGLGKKAPRPRKGSKPEAVPSKKTANE